MNGLYFVAPTLVAIFVALLFVRAGAIALMLTGMRYEQARFQALSAFTSTGFTTRESERVVNHPSRRKIISNLMIGGYAGIVTVIVSATSSFAVSSAQNLPRNVLVFLIGLAIIYIVARYTGLMSRWEDLVENLLTRHIIFEFEPAEELLHLAEGYGLVRLEITARSHLLGQSIVQIGSKHKESLILGVERGHSWIPARQMHDPLKTGDQMIVYGQLERLKAEFEKAAEAKPAPAS